MQRLETPRLTLRSLSPADAPFVFELVNDPDWLRFNGDRRVRSVADARRYIVNGPFATYEDLGYGIDLISLKGSGRPIGLCGLVKRAGLDDADLGFALLPQFRGFGYAHEAAAATLDWAFGKLALARVAAIASAENRPSIALLERLGFRFERQVTLKDKPDLLELFVTSAASWQASAE